MSVINIIVLVCAIAFSSVISWKSAARWHSKTRSAQKEDPRDQEIRELAAALSVARKEVSKLGDSGTSQDGEIGQLQDQLDKANAALGGLQEKYATSDKSLNKEIDSRERIDSEMRRLRSELEVANSQLDEFEVQKTISSPSSGLVAGLDDVLEDDEKEVFTIRHEHRQLKQQSEELQVQINELTTDSERWKQHCTVMTKTNKSMRAQLDELANSAAELEVLRGKANELSNAKNEMTELKFALEELDPLRASNTELQTNIDRLTDEHQSATTEISVLNTQVGELEVVAVEVVRLRHKAELLVQAEEDKAELLVQAEEDKAAMANELEALASLKHENKNLQGRIDAYAEIENENQKLLADIKDLRRSSSAELERAERDNEDLRIRVKAIDAIQMENEQQAATIKVLQQQTQQIDSLETELEQHSKTAQENSELRKLVTELEPVEDQNNTLRKQLDELTSKYRAQHVANIELGSRVEKLTHNFKENENLKSQLEDLSLKAADSDKQLASLSRLQEEFTEQSAEAEELKLQLAATPQLQAEIDSMQRDNDALRVDLEHAQSRHHADKVALQAELDELQQQNTDSESLRARVQELHAAQSELQQSQGESEKSLAIERDETHKLRGQLEHLSERLQSAKKPLAHDAVIKTERNISPAEAMDDSGDTDRVPTLNPDDIQDDLKSIKGVGAKIEQKLNMLGVSNFRRLVELDSQDYDRAAELIPNLKGRMHRDGWTDQARLLHLEKYS
jgi:predicted flap endonuclease-1-like 5' DNA nuclease/cell shape-determining protein MreC